MTTNDQKQAIAQSQAGYGAEGGNRILTVLRQGDFKSKSGQKGTPKEFKHLNEKRHCFATFRDSSLALSCSDLPSFVSAKGTKKGQFLSAARDLRQKAPT